MSAPLAVPPYPATDEGGPGEEGLDLSGLLDLFGGDLQASVEDELTSSWPVSAADLGIRVRELSVRAAGWGAGPQGAWRAW